MHRDNVPSLPEGFELLGSTDKCPVHGMVRYVDGTLPSEASFDKISIITLQGELFRARWEKSEAVGRSALPLEGGGGGEPVPPAVPSALALRNRS